MSDSGVVYYFGYGSNLFVPRIAARIPSARKVATAAVSKYQLRFDKLGRDGSAKANMFHTANPDDVIFGAVYAMAIEQKPVLDEIEGVSEAGYRPFSLEVETDTGKTLDVFAYTANKAAIGALLKPYSWYHALVLEGARDHGFPRDYIASIAAVDVVEDSDANRDKLNRYGVL